MIKYILFMLLIGCAPIQRNPRGETLYHRIKRERYSCIMDILGRYAPYVTIEQARETCIKIEGIHYGI